jgi:hypothetical protein
VAKLLEVRAQAISGVDVARLDDLNPHSRREDEPFNVGHRGNQTVRRRLR